MIKMVNKRTSLFLISLLLLVVSISAVSAATDDGLSDSSISTTSSDVATISDSSTSSGVSDTGSSSSDSSSSSTPTSIGSDSSDKTVSSDTSGVKSVSTTSSKDTSGSSDLSSNDVKTQTIKTSSSSSDDVKTSPTTTVDNDKNIKASSENSNLKTADSDIGNYTVSNYDELKTTIDTIKSSDVEDNVITLNPSEGTYYIDQTIVWGDDSQVATNLTIVGNGVTLDGQGKYKFLNISEGYTLTLQNVTVTNCFYNGTLQTMTPTYGGAIGNFGTLIVEDSVFSKNNLLATQGGGAIANGGTLIITNTNFTDNLSDNGEEGSGAALYNNEGNITATNCSFVGNQAQCAPVLYDDYNYLIGDEIRSTVTLTDCYIGENIITTPWEFMYGYVYNAYTTLNLVNTELDDSLIADYGGVVNKYTGKNTTISVSDATGQYNKTALIVATITDSDGKLVNEGQVAFKLNGVTIKDEDGNNILVNVRNGVARLNYTIINNPGTYTISASYSGSDNYFSARTENDATLTVENRVANLTIASKSNNLKSGERLLITVVVSDNNKYVSDGVVIYKLNSVTLKDEEGNNLQSTLSKGVATLEYTIPVDMAGKDYTLTAVYSGKNFDRAEQNATLTLIKSNVTAVISPSIIDQGENATISVTLYDQNGNQLERSTKVTIKANSKTLLNTETVNGVLNVTIPTDTFKNPYYNLTVIFGENSAYNELKLNTTLVVESNSNVANLKTELKSDSEFNIVDTLTSSNDNSAYTINADCVTLDDVNKNKFINLYEGYNVVLDNMSIDSYSTKNEDSCAIIENNGYVTLINLESTDTFKNPYYNITFTLEDNSQYNGLTLDTILIVNDIVSNATIKESVNSTNAIIE